MQAIKDALLINPLFSKFTSEQLDRIARHASMIRLEEGESIFEQGDPVERFYLVTRGQIKLYRLSPAGNEKVIEVITPGSTFAEAMVFLERPHYPVGAQALAPAELVSVDAQDFGSILKNSVDTCFLLLGDMSQRLRGLLREIDELSLHSATCRVAAALLQMRPAGATYFDLPIAKQVLASRLSITPETFSRIVKNLSRQEIISISGGHVAILNVPALERAADVCALSEDSLQATFHYPCVPAKAPDQ